FARFPGFWHLGPVRATAKYVLWRIAKRVADLVGENPLVKWSSGWGRNIDEYLRSSYTDTFFIEVAPLEWNGVKLTPAGLKTMFTTDAAKRGSNWGMVVSAIDGANLDDLETKVAAYVEQAL